MREATSTDSPATGPAISRGESNLLLVLTALGGALLLVTLLRYAPVSSGDQYIYLADAWLHGRLNITGLPPLVADQINYGGKVYIPFGPFPARLRDQLKVGLFSLEHLPTNLYYMFVKGFDPWPSANATTLSFPWLVPSIQGTSILIASPAIAYVLRPRLRQPLVLACWAAILPSFLTIILYYASGLPQFGYRYSLDFMPFVAVLLLVAAHDHFSRLQRGLIAAGVLICVVGNLLVNFQLGF